MSQPSQTILNLCRAVHELVQAREKFRIGSMFDEKAKCEEIAKRLLTQIDAITTGNPDAEMPDAPVVGRYTEKQLDDLCECGHSRRWHLPEGRCRAAVSNSSVQGHCFCLSFAALL